MAPDPGSWACLACGVETADGAPGLYCTACDERIRAQASEREESLKARRQRRRRRERHRRARRAAHNTPR